MAGEAGGVLSTRRRELVAERDNKLRDVLADGAQARDADGDLQASRRHFERAYRLAEQAGDVRARALAALGLAGLWVGERRTVASAVLLKRGFSMSLPRSTLTLRSGCASVRGWRERRTTCGRECRDPGRAARDRAAADPVPLAEALSLAHHCLLGPDHVRLRRDLAVELIKLRVTSTVNGGLAPSW